MKKKLLGIKFFRIKLVMHERLLFGQEGHVTRNIGLPGQIIFTGTFSFQFHEFFGGIKVHMVGVLIR